MSQKMVEWNQIKSNISCNYVIKHEESLILLKQIVSEIIFEPVEYAWQIKKAEEEKPPKSQHGNTCFDN